VTADSSLQGVRSLNGESTGLAPGSIARRASRVPQPITTSLSPAAPGSATGPPGLARASPHVPSRQPMESIDRPDDHRRQTNGAEQGDQIRSGEIKETARCLKRHVVESQPGQASGGDRSHQGQGMGQPGLANDDTLGDLLLIEVTVAAASPWPDSPVAHVARAGPHFAKDISDTKWQLTEAEPGAPGAVPAAQSSVRHGR
jgi:hypothetical protein